MTVYQEIQYTVFPVVLDAYFNNKKELDNLMHDKYSNQDRLGDLSEKSERVSWALVVVVTVYLDISYTGFPVVLDANFNNKKELDNLRKG